MIVTEIKITHYHYCSASARHVASVCMTLKGRIVTLLCALDLPDTETDSDRTRAFVGEASRQLGRMPEFRSGRDTLEFAEGLLNGPMVRYC